MSFFDTLKKELFSRMLGFEAIQNFLETINDPIFVLDNDAHIKTLNKQATALFGYDKHELVGKSILEFIKNEHAPLVKNAIKEACHCKPGCKHPPFDVTVITKDGKKLLCELDITHTEYGIQPHFRNITEQKKKEEERDFISNINKIISSALDIRDVYKAIAVELNKRISFDRMSIALLQPENNAIKTFAAITSYGFTELPQGGSYPLEGSIIKRVIENRGPVIIEDTSKLSTATDVKLFKEGIMSRIACPLTYKGQIIGTINLGSKKIKAFGDEYINLIQQIAPQLTIAIENSKLFCKIKEWNVQLETMVEQRTQDLNAANVELTKKNIELQKANEELRSLDKMKDNIIRDVSHELKTPLAHIEMTMDIWVENAKKGKNDPKKEEKYRRIITTNIRRLRKDIKGILHLSALESGQLHYKKEPIHFEELVHQVITELSVSAEHKGLTILNKLPVHIPELMGDKEEISRVIYNLVDNAIKYTDEGHISISANTKQNELEVSIEDTGKGIDLQNIQTNKIFERFYQEKTRSDGIGLGLAICKTIVDAHGGRIWVESDGIGKGTIFKFTIPFQETTQEQLSQPA